MKTLITTFLLLLTFTLFGQNNCSTYYPFEEGTVNSYETYNRKGKPNGQMKYTGNSVSNANGISTAVVTSEIYDKRGELILSSDYEISCSGSNVTIDFKSLLNADMMKQFSDMETEITGTNVQLPNNLTKGQSLPDAGINIAMNMAGMNMNMTTNITNRKVVGAETITTPAGTFDCVVISQETSGEMMMANFNSSQKTWLAEDVGMVKSESYKANGKLQSSTVLTSFSK